MIKRAMNERLKTLQLGCRMTLKPSDLHRCGPDDWSTLARKCVVNGECEGIEEKMRAFPDFNAHRLTLAQITGLDPDSYRVMEGYWLGNEYLERARPEHYGLFLENYRAQGKPQVLINLLTEDRPQFYYPNHFYHVFLEVTRMNAGLPLSLQAFNNCMVRWGEVDALKGKKARVILESLAEINGEYQLVRRVEMLPIDRDFVQGIKVGDSVAVHWGMMAMILSNREVKKLSSSTMRILTALQ